MITRHEAEFHPWTPVHYWRSVAVSNSLEGMVDGSMNAEAQERFSPDYSIHPGEILAETLQVRSISSAEFALRCGISEEQVCQIVNGRESISLEVATTFERVLGIRASLWMNLESAWSRRLLPSSRSADPSDS